MGNGEKEILRVPVSSEDIKRSYGVVSRPYSILEGAMEKGLREKGLQLLGVREGEEILEIGIGTGFSLAEIAEAVGEKGKAYGLDITPQMLDMTRKRVEKRGLTNRVELQEADARSMPYQDNKFDAVYLASTLELFDTPDIPRVLNEIKRVLKPGGRLGVASLTKEGRGESVFIRLFMRFYEWLHKKIPKYANCRPIYVEELVAEAGYHITKAEEFVLYKIVPWKLLVAKPQTDA